MTPVTATAAGTDPGAPAAIPKAAFDWKPVALLLAVMLLAVPAVGSTSSWLTLTVAGLAMGLIIFVIASGLTLVFGLMDVLNFGHGVFIALGPFVATSVMAKSPLPLIVTCARFPTATHVVPPSKLCCSLAVMALVTVTAEHSRMQAKLRLSAAVIRKLSVTTEAVWLAATVVALPRYTTSSVR